MTEDGQHPGTLTDDLLRSGRLTLQKHSVLPPEPDALFCRVDHALQMSRIYREAFAVELLEECMTHLSDPRKGSRYAAFDDGDRLAFEEMERLRNSLLPDDKDLTITTAAPLPRHLDWRTWLAGGLMLGMVHAVAWAAWLRV